jgi:N-methylhydantoinase A
MVATGGAGPVHACGVAQRLGLSTVIIPPLAGVASAFGFLLAPTAFDFTRSYLTRLDRVDLPLLNTILSDLEREGRAIVGAAGVPADQISVTRSVDMRYQGQGYEVRVPFANGPVDAMHLTTIQHNFEQEYRRFYGRLCDDVPIQAVNWRVVIAGPTLDLSEFQMQPASEAQATATGVTRPALFDMDQGYVETPVYGRAALPPGYDFNSGTSTQRRSFQLRSAHSTSCTPLAPSSRSHR